MNRRAFLAGLLASTGLARARAQETLGGLLTDRVEGAGAGYVILSTQSLAADLFIKRSSLAEFFEELELLDGELVEGRLGTINGFEFIS